MSADVANSCDCLKNLDELRLRLEKGGLEGFVVIADDKEGTWIWGHKPDYLHAVYQLLGHILKLRDEEHAG